MTGSTLTPSVIAAIQTFGDRVNFQLPAPLPDSRGRSGRGVDFDEVRRHVGEGYDPQTAELLDTLKRLL